MATWNEIESAVPEFAARVRAVPDAHRHKTIATPARRRVPAHLRDRGDTSTGTT